MALSTHGVGSADDNFKNNCSEEDAVVTPRDQINTDSAEKNNPAINQGLDATKSHHLQIAVSTVNGESRDTDFSNGPGLVLIENTRCNGYENFAHSLPLKGHEEKAGYTFVAEYECRICQSNGEEVLISPCKCSGSARWVHESCIVKWFQISETSSCELCSRDVSIKKTTKPLHQWRLPRGDLGPCSRVDLWYLFVTIFSISTIVGFGIFHLLVKSKEPETTAVFGAIYALCGVMILLRIHYFYVWFTRRSAFWRKWKTMNRVWKVASPGTVLNVNEAATMV